MSEGVQQPIKIAIIGGGITGLCLGLGLLHRGIDFAIYERAECHREIGAGIGFTPNAERAMKALHPDIHACFRKVATKNDDDWFRYVDGFTHDPGDKPDMTEAVICKMYLGERGFEGCRRQDFLDELMKLLSSGRIRFGKRLQSVEPAAQGGTRMKFHDGTAEQAHVIIGCDGIRSRLREIMFKTGPDAPGIDYTHKYAYRGLVPMGAARAALGEPKTTKRIMYMGPDAHALTFPVAGGALLNVVAFVTDPAPWDSSTMTAKATAQEAASAFASFGPAVRTIMALLPEELDKWAVFDTHLRPVPRFVARGGLCLLGDAAHASAPHHGAGAGCGVEDALVLADLLAVVVARQQQQNEEGRTDNTTLSVDRLVDAALETYNTVRYDRCRWLVQSSRTAGEMYEWQWRDLSSGKDDARENFVRDFGHRCHTIWDYDVEKMVKDAHQILSDQLP